MNANATYRFMVRKVINGKFMLFGWNGWVYSPQDASWLSSEQAMQIQALYGGTVL